MDYILTPDGELYHYGVKGMKWGIRRYQNKNGSLTPAGKKKARQEYKADNKQAYELGKGGTISGHAAARSMKRTIRLENKLDKRFEKEDFGSSTKRLANKWLASTKTTEQLTATYTAYKNKAEQHCKSLIDKYGEEAVSSIKYKDKKLPSGKDSPSKISVMNERTNNLSDYARAGAKSIGFSGVAAMMGAPVALVFRPRNTWEKAFWLENDVYGLNYQKQRNLAESTQTKAAQTKPAHTVHYIDARGNQTNKSTRVTGKEESDFWKALAEEELKKQRKG